MSALSPVAGCGDSTDEGGKAGAENVERVQDAIRETKSRGTLAFEFRARGTGLAFDAAGTADFKTRREQYGLNVKKLPGLPRGTKLFAYSDRSGDYIRLSGRSRYQRIPASEQSPVANGITDSFDRVALDTQGGFSRAGEERIAGVRCTRYRSRLDGDKLAERAEPGREDEAEAQGQAIDGAPVSVCLDGEDLVRGLVFELKDPESGARITFGAELNEFGTAESPKQPRGI